MASRKKPAGNKKKPRGRKKSSLLFRWLIVMGILVLVAVLGSYLWLRYAEHKTELRPGMVNELLPSLPEKTTEAVTPKQHEKAAKTAVVQEKTKETLPQSSWLEGTWVSSMNGAMLTFKGTTFSMDFPSVENRSPLEGVFQLNGKKIEFAGTQADGTCGIQPGKYTVTTEGSDIVITKISDECERRAQNLEASWFRL